MTETVISTPAPADNRKTVEIDSHAINFGPQHPAAHGVLRLILEMDGEVVERADPHIGLLHRGTEKLIEYKTYMQAVPYFDRLDYVSPMCAGARLRAARPRSCSASRCRSARKWIRTLFAEITRVLNHLLNLTTYALDVGAITPSLWGFEEREKLMEFYEAASGARLHANYFRPGGVQPRPAGGARASRSRRGPRLPEVHRRPGGTADRQPHLEAAHGRYRRDDAPSRRWPGASPARACAPAACRGICAARSPTTMYDRVEFKVPVGRNGDCYDRYLVRMVEMRESVKIIKQCLAQMKPGPVKVQDHKFTPPTRAEMKRSMEALIHHFKLLHRGLPRAGRRHLHRGRSAEGRVRRLSGGRRHQPAVSLQDPRRPASRICRRST